MGHLSAAPLLVQRGLFALRARACFVIGLLAVGLVKADALTMFAEENTLPHTIVYAKSSPYQRIVITKGQGGFQLYLNGNLQFNSIDEYRYHEALVHPALSAAKSPRRMLVMGGGDGLAVREILRHRSVESVTLVDLDPDMTSLAKRFTPLAKLNGQSLADPRVRVINQDAFLWVQEPAATFDAAIVDFPDPGTFSIGKLYTTRFFRLLKSHIAPGGAVSVQCTSPLVAPQAYWCIIRTLEAAGFCVHPYHVTVPAFGIWGFALATPQASSRPTEIPAEVARQLRFLNRTALAALFQFPNDLKRVETEINRLDNQGWCDTTTPNGGSWISQTQCPD